MNNASLVSDKLLEEQVRYYDERAAEYDDWFFRRGRFDRGQDHRLAWEKEVEQIEKELIRAGPSGEILEIACGTGIWTRLLADRATHMTAIDTSSSMLSLSRDRVNACTVDFINADAYEWTPNRKFDWVFFGFWLSHVPSERFEQFWTKIAAMLRPGGTVFFVDSLYNRTTSAKDHPSPSRSGIVQRKLKDGRRFSIVKIFHEPEQLNSRLDDMGWHGRVKTTGEFFYHGLFTRSR